jgi:hypothetical protein
MNPDVLKKHFIYRQKTLATQQALKHFDVLLETILRILTIPLFVELVSFITNKYHGRAYEFSSVRFGTIIIVFLIISPIQLYVLKWKLAKEKAI